MPSTASGTGQFEPTHELSLVGSPDGAGEVSAYDAGIEAVLDHADDVSVWLDIDLVGSDHPEIVDAIRTALEETEEGRFLGSPDAVREALDGLLPVTTVHRFVGIERLDARTDTHVLCRHVPDHHVWSLDASASPGVVEHVRAAVDGEPAVLLPAETLAEWEGVDGRHYEVSPPDLCIEGSGCFGLGGLTGVEVDEERHEIRLDWAESGGLFGRVVSLAVPDRPRRPAFQSERRFRDVATAFDPLARALERSEVLPEFRHVCRRGRPLRVQHPVRDPVYGRPREAPSRPRTGMIDMGGPTTPEQYGSC